MDRKSCSIRVLFIFSLLLIAWSLVGAWASQAAPAQDGLPPVDTSFAAKQILGRDPYTAYWPHLLASTNAAYSNTVSLVWSKGQQHLIYRSSLDGGATWAGEQVIAGTDQWGGSVGNISAATDGKGNQYLLWFQLYGYAYPDIRFRERYTDGSWGVEGAVPGSSDERMKVTAVTTDLAGNIHVMVGKGLETLYYLASGDQGATWTRQFAMDLAPNSRPDPNFLPVLGIAKWGGGQLLTAWGDARVADSYHLMTAIEQRSADNHSSWTTYSFTETNQSGSYVNGWGQYRPSMTALPDGGLAMVWENRVHTEDGSAPKDIYYREWNPAKAGACCMGWMTDSVRIAQTWPDQSEAPQLAIDWATGQRYVVWQDDYDNLRIVYSYSSDGVSWYPVQLVNGGSWTREKMPTIAIAGGKLHIAWADTVADSREMAIYYTSRPLPALYPPPPTATMTPTP